MNSIIPQLIVNSVIAGSIYSLIALGFNLIFGTTIIIVEHNLHSVLQIVDRAYVLDKGKVIVENTPEKIINSGILERVFLGKI
jgi:ABC-type branched-subunit amino acid transport system ATPase component